MLDEEQTVSVIIYRVAFDICLEIKNELKVITMTYFIFYAIFFKKKYCVKVLCCLKIQSFCEKLFTVKFLTACTESLWPPICATFIWRFEHMYREISAALSPVLRRKSWEAHFYLLTFDGKLKLLKERLKVKSGYFTSETTYRAIFTCIYVLYVTCLIGD